MPPHGESITCTRSNTTFSNKPPSRTISDISFELTKQEIETLKQLPPISEVEVAKCECCGMSEECTPEYIERVRNKFKRKWICGLCSEAVKEEMEKKKGLDLGEALSLHMSACSTFNKFGRAYPVLFQAEAMREMLRKNTKRSKSFPNNNSRNNNNVVKSTGLARSSSCIPAITRQVDNLN
ncbi:hypothetical protein ACFE04_004018 [Oxalis oulophora]